jgi:aspartate aminotransferase-like enzyme
VKRHPATAWIWAVHCETSTGVLNDVAGLQGLCTQQGIKLCLDCVSTVGTVPVQLSGIYFASGVSGKGVGSLAGLAMVFYNHTLVPAPDFLPRYLDLGYYAEHDGIPFTHSSNLLRALQVALERLRKTDNFARKRNMSERLRRELQERGFHIVASEAPTSPAIITIALAESIGTEKVGRKLEEAGFQLSYRSEYLRRRNWMQICLMGECKRRDLALMLETLTKLCNPENIPPSLPQDSLSRV